MATSNNLITQRRHDLDNLRTFLTGLVIVHHTAITYGGPGLGPYNSTFFAQIPPSIPLTVFNAFNQSFFMGTFFRISGRGSAQSLAKADSKASSRWPFVKGKLLRLGVPAVVYTLAVHPVVVALASRRWDGETISASVRAYFSGLRGIRGPVWYVATLLAFDLATATFLPLGTTSTTDPETRRGDRRKYLMWQDLGWIGVACASFLIRLVYPVGRTIKLLGIQPAYLLQYVFAYAMGYLSVRYDEDHPRGPFTIHTKSKSTLKDGTYNVDISTATTVSLAAIGICLTPYVMSGGEGWGARVFKDLWGGWNLPALGYAFWNEFSFAVVVPSLMQYFSRRWNLPAKGRLWQPRYSYAAFLVHYPVSAAVEVGVDQIMGLLQQAGVFHFDYGLWRVAGPVVMTAVVGVINVVASFCASRFMVEYIPGLKQIV